MSEPAQERSPAVTTSSVHRPLQRQKREIFELQEVADHWGFFSCHSTYPVVKHVVLDFCFFFFLLTVALFNKLF